MRQFFRLACPAAMALVTLVLTILVIPPTPANAALPAQVPRKVVLISIPLVDWRDVEAGDAPNLAGLANRWSMAAMSLRTVGPRTDLASALLTIGAGNRARAYGARPRNVGEETAPRAVADADESGTVGAFDDIRADNAELYFGAVPGALGQTLREAGLSTGVAGNADGGFLPATARTHKGTGLDRRRFGALALGDDSGKIGFAEIGDDLIELDSSTLNGYRANTQALGAAAVRVISSSDVSLIELTDTYREGLIAFSSVRNRGPLERPVPEVKAAVRRDDAMLGTILPSIDLSQDTLIVLATSSAGPAQSEGLALAILAGVGADENGWLTSATTLREGLVTVSDVGPGILKMLDLDIPEEMSGQPFRSVAGPEDGRLDRTLRVQEESAFHGQWVGRFFLIFVGLQVLLYSLAWVRMRNLGGVGTPWIRRLTLAFMAVPVSTLLLATLDPQRIGSAGPILFLLGVSSALAAAALMGPWRRFPAGPGSFICAVSLLVLIGDLATGANLQLSSLIGYSPIVAGRFYGMGNLAYAVLATTSVLLAAQIGARCGRRGIGIAVVIGLVTIVADGGVGADFGGMLSLIPAFGVLIALLFGKTLSMWRLMALGGLAALVALVVGGLDSMRPPELQTHVGRFVERLVENGPRAVQEVIVRKASANWAILTQSSLTLSVPVALVFLALMLRRPEGRLRRALEDQPGLKIGVLAAIVANVLGFALNDSGIAVPAMGLAILAPFCLATVEGMQREEAS